MSLSCLTQPFYESPTIELRLYLYMSVHHIRQHIYTDNLLDQVPHIYRHVDTDLGHMEKLKYEASNEAEDIPYFEFQYVLICMIFHCGVRHILCFALFRLVYPMLPVSLDCPFLISYLLISDVYYLRILQNIFPVTNHTYALLSSNHALLVFPLYISTLMLHFSISDD